MPGSGFRAVFPTTGTFAIFCSYTGLFVNLGILVTASKSPDGTFPYNPTTVVLLTEFTKMAICLLLHLKE